MRQHKSVILSLISGRRLLSDLAPSEQLAFEYYGDLQAQVVGFRPGSAGINSYRLLQREDIFLIPYHTYLRMLFEMQLK